MQPSSRWSAIVKLVTQNRAEATTHAAVAQRDVRVLLFDTTTQRFEKRFFGHKFTWSTVRQPEEDFADRLATASP